MLKSLFIGVLVLLVGVALALIVQPAAKRPAQTSSEEILAAPVSVVRVARAHFSETVLVTGSLVAREEVLVGPEVEGLRVTEVLADEGLRVKKGDVLARLVSDTLDAQLAQNDAARARPGRERAGQERHRPGRGPLARGHQRLRSRQTLARRRTFGRKHLRPA